MGQFANVNSAPVVPPMYPPPNSSPTAKKTIGGTEQLRFGETASQQMAVDNSATPAQAAASGESRAPATRGSRRLRLWAHIYLHMQVQGFDLVPRLIGRGG